jgi:hypothetical protein
MSAPRWLEWFRLPQVGIEPPLWMLASLPRWLEGLHKLGKGKTPPEWLLFAIKAWPAKHDRPGSSPLFRPEYPVTVARSAVISGGTSQIQRTRDGLEAKSQTLEPIGDNTVLARSCGEAMPDKSIAAPYRDTLKRGHRNGELWLDADVPCFEEMRRLLKIHQAKDIMGAARAVRERAVDQGGTPESVAKRLARNYPHWIKTQPIE